jgi:hypothetical protein
MNGKRGRYTLEVKQEAVRLVEAVSAPVQKSPYLRLKNPPPSEGEQAA